MLLAGKRLNGKQKEQFRGVLDATFNYGELEQMLSDNLDKKIENIILPMRMDFPKVLDAVLEKAERESWTAQLLQAALSKRPEDAQLIAFAQQFGPVVITPSLKELVSQYLRFKHPGFERAITPAPMHDYDSFLQGLWERGSQVCRIEANGRHIGTGFLVGPDRVMTCYHVWKAIHSPDEFVCYFNHRSASESPYHLAQNYEVAVSKHNPDEGLPNGRASTPDELDYAILRLDGEPGKKLVLCPFQEKSSPRGWMTPYSQEYTFPLDSPLYILHYPQLPSPDGLQKPSPVTLKLSLEEHAIIEHDEMRVKYITNTERASSGSPCFNANWELVAMHHFSDRNEPPQYNQGVPLAAIKKHVGPRYKSIFIPFSARTFLGANKTNGHEASENTQPVPDSYSQNQVSSEKQAPPTPQEPAVSTSPKTTPRKPKKDTASIDRRLLLKLLKKSPSGVFSEIVYSCRPPAGALSSDQAPQATRAVELLKWAEGDGGIGLSAVHDCYLEAMEIEKKASQELSRESPLETDQLGKVVPIEELREQQEAISNRSCLEQLRKHLKNAQNFAGDAYKPFATYTSFDENAKPEREKFIDAVDLLGEAEQSIQSLRELLFSDSFFIPDELLESRVFINVHIDTVIEQIEECLLPSLSQNEIGDFSKLQTALKK